MSRNEHARDRQVDAWRSLHDQLPKGVPATRGRRRSRLGWLLASAAGLAILVAPLAVAQREGQPVRLGERNPSGTQGSGATSETAIIANIGNNGQSTRQSNNAKGGRAAGYGCDNDGQAEINACANYVNRGQGPAAAFRTRGQVPFAIRDTNRGRVANLNADLLDDRQADEFVLKTDRLWAQVRASAAAIAVENTGGATEAARVNAGNYRVDFGDRNVSACSYVVTPANVNDNLTTGADVDTTDNTRVFVSLRDPSSGNRADGDFNLQLEC
jgi:hypothetical protein